MNTVLRENPVLDREMQTRWRGVRAFWVMFGCCALFAVVMAGGYAFFAETTPATFNRNGQSLLTVLGHQLFLALTWMQVLGWLLLAPALTATSLAAEREKGLLEALQLSALSAWHIVVGKLIGALSFILLLMLVPLPITALCFLLGGVSPGDFVLAACLIGMTGSIGAIVGLACSAWSRRPAIALVLTFGVLIGWNALSYAAFAITHSGEEFILGLFYRNDNLLQVLLDLFGQTNPILAVVALVQPELVRELGSNSEHPAAIWGFDWPLWQTSLAFQTMLMPPLLWQATRGVRRFFDLAPMLERKKILALRRTRPGALPALALKNVSPAGTSEADEAAPLVESSAAKNARRSEWWNLPLTAFLRFSNPILQREVHARFRLRRMPPLVLAIGAVAVVLALAGYLLTLLFLLFDPGMGRDGAWWMCAFTGLALAMFCGALMGSRAFAREREAGTWEGLKLSLLPARTIITGKLLAPLVVCGVYALLLLPMLGCVRTLTWHDKVFNGISLTQAAATLLIVAASAWCSTAWGLYLSWVCRRTMTAVAWTMALHLIVLLFAPVLLGFAMPSHIQETYGAMLNRYHPFMALGWACNHTKEVTQPGQFYGDTVPVAGVLTDGLTTSGIIFGIGCLALLLLYAAMHRKEVQV